MKELSVYYCPKCGSYGFYQLQQRAVCSKCKINMTFLPITYQDFMNLSCEERDSLLAQRIVASSSSYVQRLMVPHKLNNNRETIARMGEHITELEVENENLKRTIEWMHQTIWELVRKNKDEI